MGWVCTRVGRQGLQHWLRGLLLQPRRGSSFAQGVRPGRPGVRLSRVCRGPKVQRSEVRHTTNHTSKSIGHLTLSYLKAYLILYTHRRYWIDGSETKMLGWKPQVSFEEGLAKTSTPTTNNHPPALGTHRVDGCYALVCSRMVSEPGPLEQLDRLRGLCPRRSPQSWVRTPPHSTTRSIPDEAYPQAKHVKEQRGRADARITECCQREVLQLYMDRPSRKKFAI